MRKTRRSQEGIALITVVLILLVLTVLGLTATIMMTQEDRLSSRLELQKEAFYVAEAGLRHGERVCTAETYSADTLTAFLRQAFPSAPPCPAVVPGQPSHPVGRDPAGWTIDRLGNFLGEMVSGSRVPIVNREVVIPSLSGYGRNRRTYYTLYVRNNPSDLGNLTSPPSNQDPDNRLRLISVGFITDGSGVNNLGQANVLAVRILEEEVSWENVAGGTGRQDIMDAGATGSGVWSGERPTAVPSPTPGP